MTADTQAVPPFEASGLTVAWGGRPVLWNVDISLPARGMSAVVGPNGAGKSTLVKAALGLAPILTGQVRLLGEPAARVRRRIAYMPQRNSVDWDFPVSARDVAAMGLYGRVGWFRRLGRRHLEAADAALERVGLADFRHRQIGRLSGGQQQRIFLARALAQEAELLLLDEPFSGIDAASEAAILDVLAELEREGRHIVCIHHDLGTVAAYFDHVTLLNAVVVASGPPDEALAEDRLRRAYDASGLKPRAVAA
ncbi:MAG: ABC transporter ATP-binding protein [Alphaproteobacteria bacterium]|nr:ABC transporter ATP-binding protein [Alphaproteobacteria bacterium]